MSPGINMRIMGYAAGSAVVAAGASAASSHQTWLDGEQASPRTTVVAAGFALPTLGAAAIAASLVSRRLGFGGARAGLMAAGAGAVIGGLAGWIGYGGLSGHSVIALPWDEDFKTGRWIETRIAETYNDHIHTSRPAGPELARDPASWSFAVVGDTGGGTAEQAEIAENIDAASPAFIVHVGDLVQTKGTESEWVEKFDPAQYFGRLMDRYDVHPVIGNHDTMGDDGLDPFFRRFPDLDGERWYAINERGIDFMMLDGNSSLAPDSEQYAWLEQQLASASGDYQVVVVHQPLLTGFANKGGTLGYEQIGNLLDTYDVELVLAGHQHAYERTVELNDQGTIQVTTGSGGYGARRFGFSQPGWSAFRRPDMGHLEIEVQDDRMVGRYLLEDGSVADTWSINRDD